MKEGCTRCKVAPSSICCELCTPDKFVDFARVDLPKNKQQPKRSRIADYKADRTDFALEADLHAFRKARMIAVRGSAHFRSYGAAYIMPDDFLKRIVDCAHFHKILTSEDLQKETRWHRVSTDGEDVLALIQKHRPPPPPSPSPLIPATPLRPHDSPTANLGTPSTPSARQCSKCSQYGHIGVSFVDYHLKSYLMLK